MSHMARGITTILDKVRALVTRLSPAAICDACIEKTLDLKVRGQAGRKTQELAGSDGFVRSKNACSLCGDTKMVIRLGS